LETWKQRWPTKNSYNVTFFHSFHFFEKKHQSLVVRMSTPQND
jgi:hypothetical protein